MEQTEKALQGDGAGVEICTKICQEEVWAKKISDRGHAQHKDPGEKNCVTSGNIPDMRNIGGWIIISYWVL